MNAKGSGSLRWKVVEVEFFEYQYLPVGVLPREDELVISENGEFIPINEAAAEERGEVMQWVVNVTAFSTLVDDPACFYVLSPGVRSHENLLFNTYYWFRVVCIHIVPCTSLVVLNSALVGAIRTAQHRRSELLHHRANRATNTTVTEGGTRLLRLDNNQASTSGVGGSSRRGQESRGSGFTRSCHHNHHHYSYHHYYVGSWRKLQERTGIERKRFQQIATPSARGELNNDDVSDRGRRVSAG